MDILAYEYLKEGLNKYNNDYGVPYGNSVVGKSPKNPTYPLTIFNEIRNVGSTSFNSPFDRVASTGYSVRIEAKNKGNISNQKIAREIAQFVNKYIESFNLARVSYNENTSVNDNSIYEIIMTYSGNLHENRRNFI